MTRTECSAMRGIAILGIVLHNFSHWLGGIVLENEYTYTQGNVDQLLYVLKNPDMLLPVHLLSFFGHYGVPVFLFLSAYGLVRKYEQRPATEPETGAADFLRKHFMKLFDMMIVGYVAFILIDFVTPGPHHYHLMDVVAQLGLFNNLLPEPDHVIWPGPYWFFGLMMQLYILYRLLIYTGKGSLSGLASNVQKASSVIMLLLVVVCLMMQMLCAPESEELNRLRYNSIGGVLPFCAGVFYARNELKQQLPKMAYAALFILFTALVFGCSLGYSLWYWVPLLVIVATASFVKMLPQSWLNPLCWVGAISASMFVFHPIARKILIPISRHGDVYAGLLLYLVAVLIISRWAARKKA